MCLKIKRKIKKKKGNIKKMNIKNIYFLSTTFIYKSWPETCK